MKSNFCLLIYIIVFGFQNGNKCYSQQIASEKKSFQKVNELPEVRAFVLNNAKQHPQLLVAKTPDKHFKYYWIKVGLGNIGMFRSAFDFYVDANTQKLYYVDFMVDDDGGMAVISIPQWRTLRKEPAFQKIHYYKNGKVYLKKY